MHVTSVVTHTRDDGRRVKGQKSTTDIAAIWVLIYITVIANFHFPYYFLSFSL